MGHGTLDGAAAETLVWRQDTKIQMAVWREQKLRTNNPYGNQEPPVNTNNYSQAYDPSGGYEPA